MQRTTKFRTSWSGLARRVSLLVCLVCLLAAAAPAQTSSTISGTVKDTTGALVPGAKVELVREADGAVRKAQSNEVGFFNFAAVQPGTYKVRVTMVGFETWQVTGIAVHPGDSLSIPKIGMRIGQVVQSVTVTAEAAGVTYSNGEHSTLLNASAIERLSTQGRDVTELVESLPGFTINAGSNINNEGAGGLYGNQTTGFGSGTLTSMGANGAAPQQGLVNIVADGANVIDPGDMSGQVANVNMDQVQEVKVQTSNFGADEAKGPIVINAVGKSGTVDYHGSLYTYFRNAALNSNDWLTKFNDSPRPESKYFYPGGSLGGPVRIPGTSFNKSKKLVFWTGYEYYGQNQVSATAEAFVPTDAMLAGDLSRSTIASALNVSESLLESDCAADYSVSSDLTQVAGVCAQASGSDQYGLTVNNGKLNYLDPGAPALAKLFPKPNRTPRAVTATGQATDGYNYYKNIMATHNGFQYHLRVDENISDSLKLYATYNWEKINDESPMNNIYYNPNGTVPFPTPLYSNTSAHYLTLNLTKVLSPTLTNEFVASGVYFYEPQQFTNPALAQDTGTAWETAGYSGGYEKNGVTQLPRIVNDETVGLPSLAMGYVPSDSQYLRKASYNFGDNLTKVIRAHTLKAGLYFERTLNNQLALGSEANGTASFMRWDTCYQNIATSGSQATMSLGNEVANFVAGCPLSYEQSYNKNGSQDPASDMYFGALEGYVTDEWKVNNKLTLTLGLRVSHFVPWTDAHGQGLAVWNPDGLGINSHEFYSGVSGDPTTWPGITWHGKDSGVPVAGVPTPSPIVSPRFGLAYDLYGDGKTMFRGGWGAYRSRDSYNNAAGALNSAIGLQTWTIPGSYSCTFGSLFTPGASDPDGIHTIPACGAFVSSSSNSVAAFEIYAMDPKDDATPVTYNYNFTVDQQLPRGMDFEIAYVGNQSEHLSTLGNLQNQNVIPLGAYFGPDPAVGSAYYNQTSPAWEIPISADYRPYPNYTQVMVPKHVAWSNYNGLQASLGRKSGSLTYNLNYTWSKAMGVRGNYDSGYIADPIDMQHDYGVLAFNRSQTFNASYSYVEGVKFHGNRLLGVLLNNWEFSGITSLQSGPNLSILNNSTSFNMSGGVGLYEPGTSTAYANITVNAASALGSPDYTLQPTLTCDPRLGLHNSKTYGHQYVNGSCFALPTVGTQGLWNLPDTHGPAYFKSDLTINRDVKINDRQNLQFRAAAFNFLNHPITSFNSSNTNELLLSFSEPTGSQAYDFASAYALLKPNVSDGVFGYTAYKTGVRFVELGLKYNF